MMLGATTTAALFTLPPAFDDGVCARTSTTRLQEAESAKANTAGVVQQQQHLFPDLRPPRQWTWGDLFGRPHWRVQFDRYAQDLIRNDRYQAMPDPAQVMIPSHAIAGALLKEHHIEAYRVYQATPDFSKTVLERTIAACQTTKPQVVGLVRVGTQVDGHQGIVHGGILAMLIDDTLGYGFYSVGWPAAFTANLSVNYRAPVPAQTILRIECFLEKQERRKLHWRVRVTDAGNTETIFADATSLFVVPKHIYEQILQGENKQD